MSKHMWVGGSAIALLGLSGWLFVAGSSAAEDAKGAKEAIQKIADTIQKDDTAGADKQAAALAKKTELEDVMELFKKREKGGLGVGAKKGVVIPDGIEIKLVSLGRDALGAGALSKEAGALEEMGYAIAAIATFTKHKPAPKAKSAEWNGWADDMAKAGVNLSKAAKSKSSAELKASASKINASCNACHSAYRK